MTQETLEDVTEAWVNQRFTKQICGDESYPDIYASKESIIESHTIFAKSQQERMYSEEEVLAILNKLLNIDCSYVSENGDNCIVINDKVYNLKQWFEQFKKK